MDPAGLQLKPQHWTMFRRAAEFCLDSFPDEFRDIDSATIDRIRSGDIQTEVVALLFIMSAFKYQDGHEEFDYSLKDLVVNFYMADANNENGALDKVRERLLLLRPTVFKNLAAAVPSAEESGESIARIAASADIVVLRRLTRALCLSLQLVYFSNE